MSELQTRPRRWLITGASSGMGRALVEKVVDEGDTVVATVRRDESKKELLSTFGNQVEVEILDLADLGSIASVARAVTARGPVDVLVNNAGYAIIGAAEEVSDQEIREQLNTLLVGPILLTRYVLPSMRTAGGGRIFQFSSVGGQTAGPGGSLYNAGKWGLEGFTEAIVDEVSPFNVKLTLIEPGAVRTGFISGLKFADEMTEYKTGPVGQFRDYLGSVTEKSTDGDPSKVAGVVFQLSRMEPPPMRLALGRDAYDAMQNAFVSRLDSLRKNEHLSTSISFE